MGSRNLEWAEYNRRSSVPLHPLFGGSPTYLKLQNTHACRTQNCRKCRPSDGTFMMSESIFPASPGLCTGLLHFNSQLPIFIDCGMT